MKSAPILATAADNTTFLIIFATFKIAQLSFGSFELSDMKKYPLALLLDFGSVRYKALLCTFITILLALKVSTASGCEATQSRNFLVFFSVSSVGPACSATIALSATHIFLSTVRA